MKEDIKFFNEHKGELFISPDLQLVRLIGIAESKIDYLYILLYNNGILFYYGVLGGLIELKNKIDRQDYNRIVQSYKLNEHIYPESFESNESDKHLEYRKKILDEINNRVKTGQIKLLTEIYFDLHAV